VEVVGDGKTLLTTVAELANAIDTVDQGAVIPESIAARLEADRVAGVNP
jgi:hypothetical protein